MMCPVCDGTSLVEVYPATFGGDWREAAPFFLRGRTKAVHRRIVRCMGVASCSRHHNSVWTSTLTYLIMWLRQRRVSQCDEGLRRYRI